MPQDTNTNTTSGAAIQRYKIGYHADERAQRSSTPSVIPEASGSWVRYEDHLAALAAGQATAAQAVVPSEWPTNEMIDAGRKAAASQGRLLGSGQSLWHVFRAMLAAAPAKPATQQGVAYAALPDEREMLKHALWLASSFTVHRYLMSNAEGRWSGAEKATCHDELCRLYVAVFRGVEVDQVRIGLEADWMAVHDATQELTDHMDVVIGFPLKGVPDYEALAPKFFDHFHRLATHALRASPGQAPAGATPECLTCNDHGAVGNILTAEPCPDCTRWNVQPAPAAVPDDFLSHKLAWREAIAQCGLAVSADDPDRSYWEHELRAFDRAYSELAPKAQAADSVPAVSDLPPLPAPDLRDVGTKPQEIKEFLKGYATEYARTTIAARARLLDSDLSNLTERGAKAWAGVDAQGLRDGGASPSANAGGPSAHIKEPYTIAEIKAKIDSNDYSAEMLLQHAMLLLDSASLSANAGQAGEYPALVCDYCGALTPDPWHSSGMLHGKMSKHIHSCDACAARGAAEAQAAKQQEQLI